MDYRIFPPDELIETEIHLPLSKSESNRALIMSALAQSGELKAEVADCDDTMALRRGLGINSGEVNVGASGTAMRFLTAYYAATAGVEVVLDGSERMRHRPIGELVEALRACGAEIDYAGEEGFPPLRIKGRKLEGGTVAIDPSISSQFVSALLMVAPTMGKGLKLTLEGEPASLPYILMTLAMMERRGIKAHRKPGLIEVEPGAYTPVDDPIEEDWSAAAYWYAISAIGSAYIALPGLKMDSKQGDAACQRIFERLGAVTELEDGVLNVSPSPDLYGRLELDMSETPDLVQPAVVTCAAVGIPFNITGLSTLKIKETDRLQALHNELIKLGVETEITQSSIQWDGRRRPIFEMPEIDTYSDHRMAMSFAPVALLIPGLVIRDVDVVDKSYPRFWDDLRHAGFIVTDAAEEVFEQEPE